MPGTRVIQRIAADLLTRLPTMAAKDQHDARFVLAVVSDWPDLDDEMRNIVLQRLNLYTTVAKYAWPTAIASSSTIQAVPSNYLFPPVSNLFNKTSSDRIHHRINEVTGATTSDNNQRLQHRPRLRQHADEEVDDANTLALHL